MALKKPEDNPRGTLHEGDLLYLTVGEETELYYWSGTEWLPKILKVDTSKIEKIVNDAQVTTNQAIAQANATAQEALKKAGTLPDTNKLSDQIKQQILSSPDLSRKVAENLEQTDSGVIYNKIYQNIQKQFVSKSIGDFLMGEHDRMRDYQSYLDSKIERQTIEFNKLTESNKLYERILGTSETDAPDKLSRLVMSSDIFQTEVGKYVTDDNNLIVNSMTLDKNTIVNGTTPGVRVSLEDRTFSIYAYGLTSQNYTGFSLPIYVKKVYRGETYTLGFKYRFRYYPDEGFAFNIKNHVRNKILSARTVGDNRPPLNEWQEYQQTFTINDDFEFGEDRHFPFYVYLIKNGWVEFKEPILVRGSKTGPYKPSQFDDAYKASKEAKDIASDAQTKAIQVAEQARQAQQMAEATRTQVTQLAGSWAVRNLNSAGDVLGQINLNKDGSVKINEALVAIGEKTYIKNGVIKDGMIANLNADKISGGTIDANEVNIINLNVKNLIGDFAQFTKTLWKSYYSNMEITGEGIVFRNILDSYVRISNRSGLLTIGSNRGSVDFGLTGRDGNGLNIAMDYTGYFRVDCGKDRNTGIPLIEAKRDYVKIGTERNYVKFDLNGAYVVVNGITKKL